MKIFLFIALLFMHDFVCAKSPEDAQNIRVAVVQNTSILKITTSGKMLISEVKTGGKFQLLVNEKYDIKPSEGKIIIAGKRLSSPVKLLTTKTSSRIKLGGHLYRGDVLLVARGKNKMDIIELLSIEEYLQGVLPYEMSPQWPLEALKAQAVAARTYAVKHLRPDKDFDITAGVEKQVYKGSGNTDPRILRAVSSTKGEVLKYGDTLLPAYFHSTCGGRTTAAFDIWGGTKLKPLKGVKDAYCSKSPNFKWEYSITKETLLKIIGDKQTGVKKIKSVSVYQKDKSGRALKIKIATDKGTVIIPAKDIREQTDPTKFKSTLISKISSSAKSYKFSGKGYGHGAGMCQWGAREMALKGKNYKQILKYYYPGVTITNK